MKIILMVDLFDGDNIGFAIPDIFRILKENDIHLFLPIKDNMSFEELVGKKNILECIDEIKEMYEIDIDDEKELEERMEPVYELQKMDFNILDNIESITISDTDEMIEYLKNNPRMLKYKLILDGTYDLERNDYERIKERFEGIDNIYLNVVGNDDAISLEEYEKTILSIDKIVLKITKYHLSPLEQIMYAYDLVREHIYNMEKEDESKSLSRDLTNVLLGDKIVCAGFANIFDKVLKRLHIKAMIYELKNIGNPQTGHSRNIVYVKDDKYHVERVCFFDTTWDSKRDVNDTKYLNSYRYFALTKDEMEHFKAYIDLTFPGYDESISWEFEDYVRENGIIGVPKKYLDALNSVSRFIDDKTIIDRRFGKILPKELSFLYPKDFDLDTVMEDLIRYHSLLYDEDCDVNTLIKIWLNVRRIENLEEPEKYPFDFETLQKVIINSGWIMKGDKDISFFGLQREEKKQVLLQKLYEIISNFLNSNDEEIKELRKSLTINEK